MFTGTQNLVRYLSQSILNPSFYYSTCSQLLLKNIPKKFGLSYPTKNVALSSQRHILSVLMPKHVALKLHHNIKLDATDCLHHFTVRSFIRLHVTRVHAMPFQSCRTVQTILTNCIKKLKNVYLLILGNRRKDDRTHCPSKASLLFLIRTPDT